MYREKVDALLKEALEETKKLLMANGEKTCVFSEELNLDVMSSKNGEYFTARAVRLAKVEPDSSYWISSLEVLIFYYDHWEWTDDAMLVNDSYADLYDFVAENLNNAITYEESEKLEEVE